jgi:hypothetical protein
VLVNTPPEKGIFDVYPPSGRELETLFTLTATHWIDIDLPLTYLFAYLSISGSPQVIRGKSESSFAESFLPGRLGASLLSLVSVYDSFNALSTRYYEVAVDPAVMSPSQFQDVISSQLTSSAGNADGIKRTVSVAATVINSKNCSLAPSCASLQRSPCVLTDHTCGSCLNGYLGTAGEGNTPCRSPVDFASLLSRAVGQACTVDSECALWESCISPSCRRPPQTCVSQCSGHGECFFRDMNTGSIADECFVGDLSCSTLCKCANGWSGSSCSLDEAEYEMKRNLRAQLVSNLESLYSQEDMSEDTLKTYVSSLGAVSQNSDEISLHTAQTVLEMSLSLLGDAQRSNIPFAAVSDILSSVNSAASASLSSASDETNGRRMTDITNIVSDILDSCYFSASNSLSQGEPPITSFHNLFRIAVSVSPISTGDMERLAFGAPVTPAEEISELVTSSLTFSLKSAVGQRRLSDASIASGVSSTKARLFGDEQNLVSDSLRFHYSSDVMDASSHPSVIFTLRSFVEQSYYTIDEPLSFNTSCLEDDYSPHNYTCPIGPSETKVFTFRCEGFLANYSHSCPRVAFEPTCEQPFLGSVDANAMFNCSVISYDSWWTVCECILIASERRVLSVLATSGALEVMLSYHALLSLISIIPLPLLILPPSLSLGVCLIKRCHD